MTAAIEQALRERFTAPEWAIFFEVQSATGGAASRRADAIAMSLWPSRGLEVHGFEIKRSRSDWLRELKNPAKAETIARFCDRWWVVTTPDVVKLEELPPTWGLLVLRGTTLRQEREAPKLDAQPIGRPFLASLLRSAHSASQGEAAIRKAVDAAVATKAEEWRKSREQARKEAGEEAAKLREAIAAFEAASGVSILAWGGPAKIGAAVRMIVDGGARHHHHELRRLHASTQRVTSSLGAALAELTAITAEKESTPV